jgi:hypothetical protein
MKLFEIYQGLVESKTEAQGINILRKAQVEDGEKSLPDGTSDRSEIRRTYLLWHICQLE